MKNHSLIILLLTLILVSTSCKNELESMLEVDYKVLEVDYRFDNNMQNVRDKSEPYIIKQRNIVVVSVDINGQIIIENDSVSDNMISSVLKKYIIPNPENESMPITEQKEFELSGKVTTTKNLVIVAKFPKELNYGKYSEIRNKIFASYNEARNEFSLNKFNQTLAELIKSSEQVDDLKWSEIQQIFPIRYTETIN